MHRLWTTRDVEATAEAAWEILVDLDRWPDWGPSVRRADLDDGRRRLHEGAAGRVVPVLGPALPFRVTSWEVGRRWSWAVGGIEATGHRIEPLGPGRCRVGMSAPWPAAPYLAVCAVALRRIDELLTR